MAAKRDMTGIERRTDTRGRERFRPYVTDPHDRNRKVRGSWTYSYAEAKGWRVRALAKLADGVQLKPAKSALPTIRDAGEEWLEGARAGHILSRKREPYAPKTLRGYEQLLRDWLYPALGSIRVDELQRSQVQRLADEIGTLQEGSTTRNAIHALGALYTYLLPRYDDVLHDPTRGVVLPRASAPRERHATPQEMASLLAPLPDGVALPYALAFFAGLRKGEIQALPCDMIDLEGGWIDVRFSLDLQAGFKGPKSGAGERSVPILDGLRPYLVRQLAAVERRFGKIEPSTDERPGTLLLPSARASRWGAQHLGTKWLARAMRAWGWEYAGPPQRGKPLPKWVRSRNDALEPIGLHEGRHSFATALLRAGYDVKQVSEWIGHAQASTTLNIYVHGRGRVRDVSTLAAAMNAYMGGA